MATIPQAATPILVKAPIGAMGGMISLATSTLAGGPWQSGVQSIQPMFSSADGKSAWHSMRPSSAPPVHPWDMAHMVANTAKIAGQPAVYAEPDFVQTSSTAAALAASLGPLSTDGPTDLDGKWPPAAGVNAPFDWHLGDNFSGLKAARESVNALPIMRRVRIGHLDTGYSDQHETCPQYLRKDMAWNFVENNGNAVDPADYHGPLQNPGHGTATMALLAGNICSVTKDYLGGAPFAEIVPVRIADSVVHWPTSAIAMGIQHALGWGCDVISLSMGGVPAQAWADAVNAAYAAGCCIFAAAGDSIGGLPTHFTVYPARFDRVVSVCGVTYGLTPYFNDAYNFTSELEGSFGPDAAMGTAMSGFTPNVPWALVSTTQGYSASGAGTSASTPQVAAAAALYIQKNMSALMALPGWQKVEAVRAALFGSAAKGDFSHFGAGFLNANAALAKPIDTSRPQEPPDNLDFALLKELTGWNLMDPARGQMLMTEMTQLATKSASIQSTLAGVNIRTDATTPDIRKSVVDEVLKSGKASQTLANFLTAARAKM